MNKPEKTKIECNADAIRNQAIDDYEEYHSWRMNQLIDEIFIFIKEWIAETPDNTFYNKLFTLAWGDLRSLKIAILKRIGKEN